MYIYIFPSTYSSISRAQNNQMEATVRNSKSGGNLDSRCGGELLSPRNFQGCPVQEDLVNGRWWLFTNRPFRRRCKRNLKAGSLRGLSTRSRRFWSRELRKRAIDGGERNRSDVSAFSRESYTFRNETQVTCTKNERRGNLYCSERRKVGQWPDSWCHGCSCMCTDQSGTLAIVTHTHTHTHTHTIANVQPVLHLFQVRSLDLCQKLAAILRLSSFRRLGCCKRNRGKEREREKKKKGERKP